MKTLRLMQVSLMQTSLLLVDVSLMKTALLLELLVDAYDASLMKTSLLMLMVLMTSLLLVDASLMKNSLLMKTSPLLNEVSQCAMCASLPHDVDYFDVMERDERDERSGCGVCRLRDGCHCVGALGYVCLICGFLQRRGESESDASLHSLQADIWLSEGARFVAVEVEDQNCGAVLCLFHGSCEAVR